MTSDDYLKANTTLFWLVVMIAVGIIFIGIRFIVAPLVAANGFGIPFEPTQTSAYLWAKGTRDIVSGLFLIVFLSLRVNRRVLAVFMVVASLIPVADALIVYANVGSSNVTALIIHGGTALFMIVLATFLARRR